MRKHSHVRLDILIRYDIVVGGIIDESEPCLSILSLCDKPRDPSTCHACAACPTGESESYYNSTDSLRRLDNLKNPF